jgi:hypothetical protein
MLRFTIKATHHCFLPFSLGNTARHPPTSARSIRWKVESTRREKGCPREYTHTSHGSSQGHFKKKWKNSNDIRRFSYPKRGAVYLKKKK